MISFSSYIDIYECCKEAMLYESLDPNNLDWMLRIWTSNGDTSIDNIYTYYIADKGTRKQGDLYNYVLSIGWTREQCLAFIRFMHEDCNSFNDIKDDKEIDNALNDIFKVIAFSRKGVNEAYGTQTGLKTTLKTWGDKISKFWNKLWGDDKKSSTKDDYDEDEEEKNLTDEIDSDELDLITKALYDKDKCQMITGSLSQFLSSSDNINTLSNYGFKNLANFLKKLGAKKTATALGIKSTDSTLISELTCTINDENKEKQIMLFVMVWTFGSDGTPSQADNSINIIGLEMSSLLKKIYAKISNAVSTIYLTHSSDTGIFNDETIKSMYKKMMNNKGDVNDVKTVKIAITDVTPKVFGATFRTIFKGAKQDKTNDANIFVAKL